LLPEEHQGTDQTQGVDSIASACAGLTHAALTIGGTCGIGRRRLLSFPSILSGVRISREGQPMSA
jgi:hypothetical protein